MRDRRLTAFRSAIAARCDAAPVRYDWRVGLAFAGACFWTSYPGRLNADSLYSVITASVPAQLGNWHSPTLGWLWNLAGPALGQPSAALLLQSLLFGVFAGFLPQVPAHARGRAAIAAEIALRIALIGAFGAIGKDVVALGLILVAIRILPCAVRRPLNPIEVAILAVSALLFLLIKAPNFLTIVLATALVLPSFTRSARVYGTTLLGVLLVGLAAVPLNRWVDRTVFAAQDHHPDKQLVIFDLAAISLQTNRNAFAEVRGWPTASVPVIADCFLPNMWDSFAPWGPCKAYSAAYDRLDGALTRQWLRQIALHPVAYAQHRLTYAGALLLSRDHASWGLSGSAVNDARDPTARAERAEMMHRLQANRPIQLWQDSALTEPLKAIEQVLFKFPKSQAFALIGCLALLLSCWMRRGRRIRLDVLLPAALGVANFGMLFVFGVADPGRYMLPTIVLCYVGSIALLTPALPPDALDGRAIEPRGDR
ncbi:hypothetical protein AB5I39_04625 [Sphingomonas sp. MMS24-J45]|uniref:hypothetical protein n=1 Tax=Sphingomonas sp. MMS24-J45 TaxID=3238806 RepID=UPI00384D5A61